MTIPRPFALIGLCLPWLVALTAIGCLFVVRYPASGIFSVSSRMDGQSAWINPFLPAERTSQPGRQADGWTGQRVLDDPTYFTARVPGPYDTVDVSLEYRAIHQPLLEFGLVRDAAGKELELRPLFAEQLAPAGWTQTVSKNIAGYVRNIVSPSRLSDPNPDGLAVWDATPTMPLLSDPDGPVIATPVSLRGSHDFYVVPAGGKIRMTFTLQAANRTGGSDIAVFRMFRGDEEIQREAFGASGSHERRMGQKTEHDVLVPDASPGVYRISFVANDDVFLREIQTTSLHWVVGPRIYFGDVVGYATTTFPGAAWTDSRHIVAETFHNEGLQQIAFASGTIRLAKTHVATRLDRQDVSTEPATVRAPKGDVRIIGDGLFALRQDAYFEARPRRFTDGTNVDRENIHAVITTYAQPERLEDGWLRSTFTFTLDPTLDRLRFVLSAPGIASRAGAVDVRLVQLTYHRPAQRFSDWLHTMRQELANAWHRL
jgi:hypothetical protein